jgi:hypothetical protein
LPVVLGWRSGKRHRVPQQWLIRVPAGEYGSSTAISFYTSANAAAMSADRAYR